MVNKTAMIEEEEKSTASNRDVLYPYTVTAERRHVLGITSPSALEIALGLRPRAIPRASGCKIPALANTLGPRGMFFPIHPSSRQCTDTLQSCLKDRCDKIVLTSKHYFLYFSHTKLATSGRILCNYYCHHCGSRWLQNL